MSTIVLRSVVNRALTSTEIDANFDNLNTDKVETTAPVFSGLVTLPSQSIALTDSNLPDVAPSLNLDFANSKQLDSRITFGRGSGGAYYDGKTTAKAEENLLKYSQGIGGTGWILGSNILGSSTTAPDGTTTASSITENTTTNNHYIGCAGVSVTAGQPYTFSIYLKKGVGATAPQYVQYNAFSAAFNCGIVVDLNAGTVHSAVSAGAVITSSNSVSVGSGWYRFIFTATALYSSTSGNIPAIMFINNNPALAIGGDAPSYLGAVSSDLQVWGAQLEQRSSVTAYTPTTTSPITNYIPVLLQAPLNTPRFDHDSRPTFNGTCTVSGSAVTLPTTFADGSSPSTINKFYTGSITISGTAYVITNYVGSTRVVTVTGTPTAGAFSLVNKNYGQSLGLLIEEARENKTPYSSSLVSAYYNPNATAILNTTIAPDGTLTADSLIPTVVGNAPHGWGYNPYTADGTSTYTFSVYLKLTDIALWKTVRLNVDANSLPNAIFDLSTGTVVSAGYATASIIPVGNGWYRCIVSGVSAAGTNNRYPIFYTGDYTAGDGYSGIYVWGAQLEAGSFATSYIPTPSNATVTRQPDNPIMNGTNFSSWYNQSQGTFVVIGDYTDTSANYRGLYSSGGHSCFIVANKVSAGRINSYDNQRSAVVVTPKTTLSAATAYVNSGVNIKIGNIKLAVNGVYDAADDLYQTYLVSDATYLWIGYNYVQYQGYILCGHIKKLTYYPKALTSQELQGLTKL